MTHSTAEEIILNWDPKLTQKIHDLLGEAKVTKTDGFMALAGVIALQLVDRPRDEIEANFDCFLGMVLTIHEQLQGHTERKQ